MSSANRLVISAENFVVKKSRTNRLRDSLAAATEDARRVVRSYGSVYRLRRVSACAVKLKQTIRIGVIKQKTAATCLRGDEATVFIARTENVEGAIKD